MTVKRVYSQIIVKSMSEDAREITGIASTIATDRDGDIVDPGGAEFKLPIPLLWQHDRHQPIGEVTAAKLTKAGIEIKAKLVAPTQDMPSQMVARLNEAWASIKSGLVRGLSIGFTPLEYSFLDGGGMHFVRWGWYELSAVTVPANQEASITSIKSLDSSSRAALGIKRDDDPHCGGSPDSPPGVTGKKQQPAPSGFFYAKTKGNQMNVQEQIKALEAKRKELADERVTIQTKAADEGRTKDASESERFGEITAEIKALDTELADLREMEKDLQATAKPVHGKSQEDATASRGGASVISVKHNHAEKGLAMAQLVRLKHQSGNNPFYAAQIAESQKGSLDPRVVEMVKAAVPAGNTGTPAWGGVLVAQGGVIGDFVEFLRPQTILGKFGQGGIPALRGVPFNVPLVGQATGGAGYWVGEGKAKPLTQFAYGSQILQPLKVANIAVITEELLKRASVAADTMIRDQLVAALRERLDTDFVNPAKAAVANISPASITNGVAATASSGNDADAVRTDVRAIMGKFLAASNVPSTGVWLMGSATALALSLMLNPLGQPEFPGITMTGGTFLGLPAIVSDYVPAGLVILANASDIYFADEGGFEVDLSREASLEMDNAPSHDSNTPTAATGLVSMFQTNSVAFRAERHLNWAKRRPGAVQVLTGVNWGVPAAGGGE
ncbi:phage major capsid protein [Lampropedia aestuarii]|uniref:Phage major capsid protein n=1 Tax=Lampropedia aestuarii TaxID=2562762 RepID=A0A4S5BFZ4_9BURK|nr:phage major capsid protein [Lampropedia aestuarii]THJ30949.1 phage major capsid protein [Lampropedia aestuarii]